MQATEKLQSALLNSISHELRTPLVAITGALSSLKDDNSRLNDAARRSLAAEGYEEAERLNRLMGNLLGMTRIEAGALRVRSEPSDVQEVIGISLERVAPQLQGRAVQVTVAPDLPAIPMDPALIVQVLVNLIDNAVKYSPAHAPITISAEEVPAGQLQIAVADRGSGIPPDDLGRIFDKFYRVHRPDNVTGTGLGLSICRGIVEAHGGRIWAENQMGGGLKVAFTLPLRPSVSPATEPAEETPAPPVPSDATPSESTEALALTRRNNDE